MSTTRAPCPQCDRGPRDTALAITKDDLGIREYCHRCHFTRTTNRTAYGHVIAVDKPQPNGDLVRNIWLRSVPLRGTIAESYLQKRGCVIPPADGDLRFLAPHDSYPASMIGLITDAVNGAAMSLHFTMLDDSGGKLARRMLAGHPKKGGVIRLWPADAVAQGLGIAEGIETALSAAHVMTPVWAAIDAGNLSSFPCLQGVSLTIYADNDDVGIAAAKACASRWLANKQQAVIYTPATANDVNDLVRGGECTLQ